MKILAITDLYPSVAQPTRGIFVRHSLRALAEHCDVRVVVPLPTGLADPPEAHDGALRVHRVAFREPRILSREFTRAWAMRQPVARAVRDLRTDFAFNLLLGVFLVPGGWLAIQEAKRYGLPAVAVGLGSDINLFRDHWMLGGMARKVARSARRLIVNTEGLVAGSLALGARQDAIQTLHFGFAPETFFVDRADAITPPLVVMAANLVPVKQPQIFLQALRRLGDAGIPFQAEICGDGFLRNEISNTIKQGRLSDLVRLRGAVPQADLAVTFRRASVVVLTSHAEGLPFVLIEALACGTPVVASDLPGIREIVRHGENGLLVPVGDVAGFTTAIHETLSRSWDHAAIAASVRDWTWERHGESFAALLRDCPGMPAGQGQAMRQRRPLR